MRHRAINASFAFILKTSCLNCADLDRSAGVQRLAFLGESAFALRQWERLRDVGNTLLSLPLPVEFQSIGAYFAGLAANTSGETSKAERLLEQSAERAPATYRGRSLLTLGTITGDRGDLDGQRDYFLRAARLARSSFDLYTAIHARRGLAIHRAIEGDHGRALDELESLWPLVRAVAKSDPVTYLDYLNSLAVELGEIGQVERAVEAARIVTASSVAVHYPEWQETAQELAALERKAFIIRVPEAPEREADPAPVQTVSIYYLAPVAVAYTAPAFFYFTLARYSRRVRVRAPNRLSEVSRLEVGMFD